MLGSRFHLFLMWCYIVWHLHLYPLHNWSVAKAMISHQKILLVIIKITHIDICHLLTNCQKDEKGWNWSASKWTLISWIFDLHFKYIRSDVCIKLHCVHLFYGMLRDLTFTSDVFKCLNDKQIIILVINPVKKGILFKMLVHLGLLPLESLLWGKQVNII